MENFNLSDIAAVTRGTDCNDGMFGGNGSWLIIILLFLFGFGNGNGFGGRNDGGNVAALDSSYSRGFEAAKGISDGISATYNTSCATQKEILESRYFNALELQKLSSDQAACCCKTQATIHEEGERTRALITAGEIQSLRDTVLAQSIQLSNQAQTANLVNILDPRPIPAYPVCRPYCGFGDFSTLKETK